MAVNCYIVPPEKALDYSSQGKSLPDNFCWVVLDKDYKVVAYNVEIYKNQNSLADNFPYWVKANKGTILFSCTENGNEFFVGKGHRLRLLGGRPDE